MRREGSLMVIGAAIGDVTVMPAPKNLPSAGSTPMERIRLSTGGDALNEATVAARLGCRTALVTLLGRDDMAAIIRGHCDREGVRLLGPETPEMDTGLNVVLVDETGERHFLTNANSTLRRLSLAHILPVLETEEYAAARAVCLASLFVSPALTLTDTEALFRRVKADGKLLCADTTRPKHGETAADAAGALKHLDWFFPNLEEALRLTKADSRETDFGEDSPSSTHFRVVPAVPGVHCVDATGAGDTFAASFQCALLAGEPPVRCAAYANAVASLCVEQPGATSAALAPDEIARRRDAVLARL